MFYILTWSKSNTLCSKLIFGGLYLLKGKFTLILLLLVEMGLIMTLVGNQTIV